MVSKRKSIGWGTQTSKKIKVDETKEDKKVITSKGGRKKSENKVDEDDEPRKTRSNPQLIDSLPLHQSMCVDLESLGRINFDIPWVKDMKLTKLLTGFEFTYDGLVREFYRNLTANRMRTELHSYVRNVKIDVDCKLLETLFDLHHVHNGFCIDNRAEKDLVCKGFNDSSFKQLLLEDTDKPFGVGNFKAHARFMHMVIIKNILPKSGSKDKSTLAERMVMWHLINNRPMDFAQQIIYNILNRLRAGKKPRENSVHLPHGNLLTPIFNHFKVPISDNDKRSRCSQTINAKYWLRLANLTKTRGWVLVKFVDPCTDVVIYDKHTVLSHAGNEDGGKVEEADDDHGADNDDDGVDNDDDKVDDDGAVNDHDAAANVHEFAVHDTVENEVDLTEGNEIHLVHAMEEYVEQETAKANANDKNQNESDILISEFEDVGNIAKAVAELVLLTEPDFDDRECGDADINRDTFADHSRDEAEGGCGMNENENGFGGVRDAECAQHITGGDQQQYIAYGASMHLEELDNDIGKNPERSAEISVGREELPPPNKTIKKLLILDLNGVLVCPKPFHARPYCAEFLQFCFDHFEVAFWSSKMKHNVESVLPLLLPLGKDDPRIKFIWDQTRCLRSKLTVTDKIDKPLMFKDLEAVWDEHRQYNSSNTVLIDDSPYKAFMNSDCNFIFPKTYKGDKISDNFLDPNGSFVQYLKTLANADDVNEHIRRHRFGEPGLTEGCHLWDRCKKAISPPYRL